MFCLVDRWSYNLCVAGDARDRHSGFAFSRLVGLVICTLWCLLHCDGMSVML